MKRLLVVALAGALARGALYLAAPPEAGLRRFEPSLVAADMNRGRGFVFRQYGAPYRAWKEPLYIAVLAGLMRVAGDRDAPLLVLQGLTGCACGVGVAWIAGCLLGDGRRATVAGVLASVNPFLVYYDTHFVHPLSLDVLLFLLSVAAVLRALRTEAGATRRGLAAGIACGVALWQRATLLAAAAGAWIAALLVTAPEGRSRRGRQAAIALATSIAVVSPWLVRNQRLVGRFVPTTDFAHVLWLGNNPLSNGTYSDAGGQRVFYLADPAFQGSISQASEAEQYDLFLAEVGRFVREHPGRFATLVLTRLRAFFWFTPNAGIEYAPWQATLYGFFYSALLGLGLLGLVAFWRAAAPEARGRALVLLGAVFGLATVHSLTALNLKHRVPFEMVLCVFAAGTGRRPGVSGSLSDPAGGISSRETPRAAAAAGPRA
jgi:4-amino-4-deoxy-L-arabinose transferase-like glycosyltransferase